MDQARRCAKCDERPAGAGGILCPNCRALLSQQGQDYWHDRPPFPAASHNDHLDHPP